MSIHMNQERAMHFTDTDYGPIVASLAKSELLGDTELFEAAVAAHEALLAIQDEYLQLEREISQSDENHTTRTEHRNFTGNSQYCARSKKQRFEVIRKTTKDNIVPTSHRSSPAKALHDSSTGKESPPPESSPNRIIKPSAPRKSTINDPLAIDMNVEHITVATPKRERKPRIVLYGHVDLPLTTGNDDPPSPLMLKRKRTHSVDVLGAQNNESDRLAKRRVIANDQGTSKAQGMASAATVVTPNPTRGEAMRKVWAKRQMAGTNGRYGGAPVDKLAKHNHELKARLKTGMSEF